MRVGQGEVRDRQGRRGVCLSKDSGSTGRVASKSTYISTFPGLLASNLLSPAPGLSWQEEMDWLRCGGAWLASGPVICSWSPPWGGGASAAGDCRTEHGKEGSGAREDITGPWIPFSSHSRAHPCPSDCGWAVDLPGSRAMAGGLWSTRLSRSRGPATLSALVPLNQLQAAARPDFCFCPVGVHAGQCPSCSYERRPWERAGLPLLEKHGEAVQWPPHDTPCACRASYPGPVEA